MPLLPTRMVIMFLFQVGSGDYSPLFYIKKTFLVNLSEMILGGFGG